MPPAVNPASDGDNGSDALEGTSEVVVAPARAWMLFQVRVSADVWAWTHRAAVLMRLNVGEVIERAIHTLAQRESQRWPEEDLPRLGRWRRR
jgi:hypothetical protein